MKCDYYFHNRGSTKHLKVKVFPDIYRPPKWTNFSNFINKLLQPQPNDRIRTLITHWGCRVGKPYINGYLGDGMERDTRGNAGKPCKVNFFKRSFLAQ